MVGIKIKNGSRKFVYRDITNIRLDGDTLKFETSTVCLGNGEHNGHRCQRKFDASTVEGVKGISNPVLVRYEKVNKRTTTVIANMKLLEGFETFEH